ncbi:limonene-1,2-epoxide hydrolase family protein [Gordonia sp. CPCC 205515]|uniref:limonene-1,2-epoxide hydrolase family protein n=1 Tax=Gordonia sp. CPCC 205515 TaxID=3140791 RepID=UPI003AF37C8A
MTSQTPIEIVTRTLDEFARGNIDAAMADIDDDIAYTNVSLPTVRGKRKVAKVFARMDGGRYGFNYRMLNVSADGPVVLTERIDELRIGRVAIQFWVCGRFEIVEGRIAVWRDYFDYFDFTKGMVRGLAAAAVPSIQRRLPAPSPV